MRDVSSKPNTLRTARAIADLKVSPGTIRAVKSGRVPKSDPLAVARVAGIQAAKNTSLLIPYCHQVPLDYVGIEFKLTNAAISITTEVKAIWKTGVEMEALVAASTAALALYDMLKVIDETMEIISVRLVEKTGGKSQIKESGRGVKAAVLVISDTVSAGKKKDVSGRLLVKMIRDLKAQVVEYRVLPDDMDRIETELVRLADNKRVDLIATTGGTGVSPRDVTPEATMRSIERELVGVEEILRGYGQQRTPFSMLSRGMVGVRGKTLIVNLPGSVKGVEDGIAALFPAIFHTFKVLRGGGHDVKSKMKSQK
jgi:molybdenum cofactor biosynthesis protein MoaC